MSDAAITRLRRRAEAFLERLSREQYRALAGLEATPAFQAIYAEFADVHDEDAVAMTREAWAGAPDGEERRRARMLLEWVAETHAGQVLAPMDEQELAWEASAVVTTSDGRQVPYARVSIEVANERDRAERLRLDAARAALVSRELAPRRRERFQREKEQVESLDVAPDYVSTFTTLSGIDLPALAEECRGFLRDTQAMWDDVLPTFLRQGLGITPAEATRADAQALLRMPGFDDAFSAGAMEVTVRNQVAAMGVDPMAGGRIRYDVGERAGKRARAFCAPVQVPAEVYLVLRPHGGASDWRTLLHELGHALHFAYARPELPFEYRWAGDHSVTEGYAMLFDHLMQDRGWLLRYSALGKPRVDEYLRLSAFEELHFLRRYCAKLLYELELYGGRVPWGSLPDLYVEQLRAATNFRYHAADSLVDVDPRFYAARYLRAWQLQAALGGALRAAYNEDWYRNPAAGPWLTSELLGEGQRELADELAVRVTGGALDFAPVVRGIEERLGG